MSIFSFFSRKSAAKAPTQRDHAAGDVGGVPPPASLSGTRKSQRMEHRELLYGAVRNVMLRAGVLAASYKFKVLSLDARGLQYLVMMDLLNASNSDMLRLSEIEAMIMQAAKDRHDLLVTAVYWRRIVPANASGAAMSRPLASTKSEGAAYQPLQQAEVDAFKQALASTPSAKAVPGQVVTSGRRRQHQDSDTDFEETRLEPTTEPGSSLSVTQYGDLN